MQSVKLACLFAIFAATPCQAQMLSLNSDQGVRGAYRYCEYNNGRIYGLPAASPCPQNLKEPTLTGRGMGYFMSETHEGSSKLCIYRVSGQDRSLRVETHAQCPLNQEF